MISRLIRAALVLVVALGTGLAGAQAWPTAKPIRIIIAYGPGSGSDIFARMIAEPLEKALQQTVIVESRAGAAGQIAAEYVAHQPADGYTLFLTTNTTHSANPYLFKKLKYDPIKDFTPISRVGYFPFVLLVKSELPVTSVKELIDYAKTHRNSVSYSYTSSAGQIAAAALSNTTDMDAVGVAYKSAPEAINAVMGGQVTYTVLDFATSQALTKSGRLRALAVTPQTRTALAPQLPTIAEATGLTDFGLVAWQGFFGPADLPAPVVERLNTEFQKILSPKSMQDKIFEMGAEPSFQGPADFATFIKDQLPIWERQVKVSGMTAQ
jgi:tripartite-type tricarboxylate transporter receptor subunit TctC